MILLLGLFKGNILEQYIHEFKKKIYYSTIAKNDQSSLGTNRNY